MQLLDAIEISENSQLSPVSMSQFLWEQVRQNGHHSYPYTDI